MPRTSCPGADGTNAAEDAGRFLAWSAGTDKQWLVILDDLTTVGDLQGLWSPQSQHGHTVVTTRLRDPALTSGNRHLIDLDVFTPAEAATYLRTRLNDSPHLADDVDGLARDLGYLPLALSQATASILGQAITCSTYRARLADRGQHLDDLLPRPDRLPDDYTRTIATTLSISIDAAACDDPTGLTTLLLELASVLSPAAIPLSVLTTTTTRTWLASHAPGAPTPPTGRLRRFLRSRDSRTPPEPVSADALPDAWPDIDRDTTLAQTLRTNTTTLEQHHPPHSSHPTDTHCCGKPATASAKPATPPAPPPPTNNCTSVCLACSAPTTPTS